MNARMNATVKMVVQAAISPLHLPHIYSLPLTRAMFFSALKNAVYRSRVNLAGNIMPLVRGGCLDTEYSPSPAVGVCSPGMISMIG